MASISVMVSDHIDYIKLIEEKSPNTVKQRTCYLRRFCDFVGADADVRKIDNSTIERWIIHLKKANPDLAGRSINAAVSHVRSFFFWCQSRRGLISAINFAAVPRQPEVAPEHRYCCRKDVERAVAAAMSQGKSRRAVIVQLFFDSCMRLSELTSLKRTDIKGRQIVYVGKGRKQCRTVISCETAVLLEWWLAQHDSVYVFPSPANTNRPLAVESVRRHVSAAFLAVGIEGMRPHDMRHSGATDLELNGAPIQFISRILNHSKLTTTQIYTHAADMTLVDNFDTYRGNFAIDKSLMAC